MTDEPVSLSLLKGAKADVAAELAHATDTAAVEKFDVTKLTSAQIDAFLKENEVELPEGWAKFKVDAKRAWVLENLDISDDEAQPSDASPAPAEAPTPTPAPEPAPAPAAAVPQEVAPTSEDAPAATPAKGKKAGKGKGVAKSTVLSGEIVEPDAIQSMVHEIENMKEAEAKSAVIKLADAGEVSQFKLGGVLALIQSHGWHKPYNNFREYVEQEIGMHYRKATYWVGIYNCLIEANIPWEKVKKVGWTKLKEIADVLTADNVDHWVDTATKNNTNTLIGIVKAFKQSKNGVKQIEGDTAKEVTTMTFKVHQGQKDTILAAIDKAKADTGTDVATVALEHIAADFLGGMTTVQRLQKMGLDAVFEAVEKAFPNVKLSATVEEADEGTDGAAEAA